MYCGYLSLISPTTGASDSLPITCQMDISLSGSRYGLSAKRTPSTTENIAVAAPIDKSLTYAIPAELNETAQVGVRVRVPLGRRTATGYILSLGTAPAKGLKPIREVLDAEPLFSEASGNDLRRAAAYYRFPIGDVMRTALPAGLSGTGNDISTLRERVYQAVDQTEPPRAKWAHKAPSCQSPCMIS